MNTETVVAPEQTNKPVDGESVLNAGLGLCIGWSIGFYLVLEVVSCG